MSVDGSIIEVVNSHLAEEFELEPDALRPDAQLVEDLGMDSLDLVDMVLVLQNAFGVKLREEPRVRQVRTLGDVYSLIASIKQEMGI